MSHGHFFSGCDPWFDRRLLFDDGRFIDAWLRWGGGIEGGPAGVRGLTVKQQLEGLVPGDTRELTVFPVIPSLRDGVSRTVVNAWLTIKDDEGDLDAPENLPWSASGARQKITATNNPGFGQIRDQTSPELRFDLTAGNTAFLTGRRTYYFDCRIEMSDGALYSVDVGNFTTGQPVAIPQGAQMSILRTIHRNTQAVGNVGAGLDNLHSFTLPAGSLKTDGDYLVVEYAGNFSVNDNNKRLGGTLGGVVYFGMSAVDIDQNGGWTMSVRIIRLSSTSVRISHLLAFNFLSVDSANVVSSFNSGSYLDSRSVLHTVPDLGANSVAISVQGEGVADNDITQNLSIIELSQQ